MFIAIVFIAAFHYIQVVCVDNELTRILLA